MKTFCSNLCTFSLPIFAVLICNHMLTKLHVNLTPFPPLIPPGLFSLTTNSDFKTIFFRALTERCQLLFFSFWRLKELKTLSNWPRLPYALLKTRSLIIITIMIIMTIMITIITIIIIIIDLHGAHMRRRDWRISFGFLATLNRSVNFRFC